MELKEVIKKTIKGIALSIVELGQDDELAMAGCVVSPYEKSPMGGIANQFYWGYFDGKAYRRIDEVSFTLAISQSDSTDAGGGLNVSLMSIGAKTTSGTATQNTVSFSIPVVWPVNKANGSDVE